MSLSSLAGMIEPRELWNLAKVCQGCGLALEPDDAQYCYLCSSGFSFSHSIELKGGGIEMVEQQVIIEPKAADEQSDAVKARPVFKAKIGAFSSAVFLDEINGRNLPSVVIEKSFTADGKSWKHYKLRLLNAAEVDKLICVLQDTKRALYTEDFQ